MSSKILFSLTFAVKYFNQKTPNDTLMKHFLSENMMKYNENKMNVFDGSKIDFFAKIYTHLKLGNVQPTQSSSPEGETLGGKICEKTSQTE